MDWTKTWPQTEALHRGVQSALAKHAESMKETAGAGADRRYIEEVVEKLRKAREEAVRLGGKPSHAAQVYQDAIRDISAECVGNPAKASQRVQNLVVACLEALQICGCEPVDNDETPTEEIVVEDD